MRLGRPQPASTLAGGFALDSGVVGSGLLSDGLSQLQLPQGFGCVSDARKTAALVVLVVLVVPSHSRPVHRSSTSG